MAVVWLPGSPLEFDKPPVTEESYFNLSIAVSRSFSVLRPLAFGDRFGENSGCSYKFKFKLLYGKIGKHPLGQPVEMGEMTLPLLPLATLVINR